MVTSDTAVYKFHNGYNLKDINFVEVESTTAKAVQYLFISQETECAVTGYCQQVVCNECVNLSQGTRHAIQFGSCDKVVEIARRHSAQKVPLTELDHRRHLSPDNELHSPSVILCSKEMDHNTLHVLLLKHCELSDAHPPYLSGREMC